MSTLPAASAVCTPLAGAAAYANHQRMVASSPNLPPSRYAPVPVGANLAGGVTGAAYSEALGAQGGTSPYTFAVTGGALPAGLSLSSAGVISGTPAATGTASFTVTVTDSLGYTGSYGFEIEVSAPAGGGGGGAYTFVA